MNKNDKANTKNFIKFLKRTLNFRPQKKEYYNLAFIHKSATFIDHNGLTQNNERLEFLGDAILDAIISDILYKKFPKFDEGLLTKTRSKLVNTNQLSFYSKKLNLPDFLVVHTNNTLNNKHFYADSFEAFIGAIYLDRGYKKTYEFVKKQIIEKLTDLDKIIHTETNHKSSLIEFSQKNNISIKFDTNSKNDKSSKFISKIFLDGYEISQGEGRTKKEAEQNAALVAMKKINPYYNNAGNIKTSK
jgi:ribonuclease-3